MMKKTGILLYADDLVLMAETESELQLMLDTLSIWCRNNKIRVNQEQSKIIHFRTPSVPKSSSDFKCGDTSLDITSQYNYLGLTLTEFLNYDIMAANVAKSASRAEKRSFRWNVWKLVVYWRSIRLFLNISVQGGKNTKLNYILKSESNY